MLTPHPLGPYVRRFLLEYIIADRCLSPNTQKSYRDTIRLLLRFTAQHHAVDFVCLTVEQVNPKVVQAFLTHLKEERGNSPATRNQRLVAIHSLLRFIARQAPELLDLASQVQSIPLRRTAPPPVPYLEKQEMDALLGEPDLRRPQGLRDYALLLFLYNTGARAHEAAGTTVGDLNLNASPSVHILGKGGKTRICPLWSHTVEILHSLLGTRIDGPPETPVFLNVRGTPITRFGIRTMVRRVAARASKKVPSLRDKKVSPHTIRHTTAVHLLRAGVDINTIRAWLGHASLETTNRYAEVDLEMKTKALNTCAATLPHRKLDRVAAWRKDKDLMAFLDSL